MTDFAEQFVALEGIYLLSHSVGRPPITGADALNRNFLQPWMAGDADVWPNWLACIEEFRQTVAQLLNTTSALVCPQVNLSSSVTKILGALPRPSNRSRILLSEDDFPSMAYVLQQAKNLGYQLKFIPRQENTLDLDVWRHHLTDDVAFALVTHVHSNSSRLQPARDIIQLARERGVLSIFDIAQSVGALPIDLAVINADLRLKHADVHFDNRATGIRLSPHIYNNMAEINAVIASLLAH